MTRGLRRAQTGFPRQNVYSRPELYADNDTMGLLVSGATPRGKEPT